MPSSLNSSRHTRQQQSQTDRLGLQLAQRLHEQAPLPADIQERLRAAREQALAQALQPAPQQTAWQRLSWRLRHAPNAWWNALAATAAVVTFSLSFVLFSNMQSQQETADLARVDTLLLTDDLPPEAYADPGFLQFLRNSSDSDTE